MPGFTIHVDRDLNLDVHGGGRCRGRSELKKRFQHFNHLNRQEKSEQVFLGAVRYGPYAMFVLMPVFALLQMIAYCGRGRRYPDRPQRYAEHLVFAAHTHAFLFLVGVLALAIPVTPVRIALAVWWLCTDCGRRRWSIAAAGSGCSPRGARRHRLLVLFAPGRRRPGLVAILLR